MSKTPARLIVEAFGNCEALADMYTDDVVWRLNYSLPANIAGPHIGKAAVTAFNDAVFNKIYDGGNMQINIHDEIGNEQSSVVRFDIHATSRRGNSYDVVRPVCQNKRWQGLRGHRASGYSCVDGATSG